jgi:8-oxo-dGTP diphosphatase
VLDVEVQSLIQPRFVGDSVGLAMTTTFVALAFWAWLLVPLGALLAIPLTLLIKALLVDVDPAARCATALAGSLAPEPRSPGAPEPRSPANRGATALPARTSRSCCGYPHSLTADRLPYAAGFTRPGGCCRSQRAEIVDAQHPDSWGDRVMTTIDRAAVTRQVFFHDPSAPIATVVVPSVFVAARWLGRLLLVRRCDSGTWELPGGRVDVGETAVAAAVRETAEEAGVQVVVTEFAGLFTDPGQVVRSPEGEVRQQFAVLFRARAVGGVPHGDLHETSEAAWAAPADLPGLAMEPSVRMWMAHVLALGDPPHLG